MNLCLTKKVQALLHLNDLENMIEVSPQLWHVNFILFERKKLFLFVHALTGFTLIFYGLKIKHFDHLDSYFKDSLNELLLFDGFILPAIETFINDQGTVVYNKTNNSIISNSTEKLYAMESYLNLINKDVCFQKIVSHRVNQMLSKNMKTPREHLNEYLLKLVDVTTSHVGYELDIKLNLGNEYVLRRVVVPNYYTLDDLHIVIQKVFGWKNMHLHKFVNNRNKQSYSSNEYVDEFFNPLNSKIFTVEEAFSQFDEWVYLYDFGDGWKHELFCRMSIHQPELIITYCNYHEGKNVPEDVGGILGHHHFKEVMKNPNQKEYDSYYNWLISIDYEKFDIESVNFSLAHEFPLGFDSSYQIAKKNKLGYKIY